MVLYIMKQEAACDGDGVMCDGTVCSKRKPKEKVNKRAAVIASSHHDS